MLFSKLLQCNEFRTLAHQQLDGLEISETSRRSMRVHREACNVCSDFQDKLLQVAAVAPEVRHPREYESGNHSVLFHRVLETLNTVAMGSSRSVSLPVGRLDPAKSFDSTGESPSGKITDLAKFLLGPDEPKLEKLINHEQGNIRVNRLRHSSSEALLQLQDFVAGQASVVGTMVIAPDGSIIAKRLASTEQMDGEALGVWANVAYHNAQAACQVLGHSTVTQLVSRTDQGFVIIAKVQDLTLLVLVDGDEDESYKVVARIRSLG